MAQVLVDESKPPHVRALAGINIKNLVDSRNLAHFEELSKRWLMLDPQLRAQVKSALLGGLGNQQKDVRRACSQAVAGVALVEIPARSWNDCIETLCNMAKNPQQVSPMQREAALMTTGYICESIDPDVLGGQTNVVLSAIIKCMSPQEDQIPVRLAAVKALLEAVEFIHGNMMVEGERTSIMQAVCANTQINNIEVKVASFQVLVEIARMYYAQLPTYMQTLFNLSLRAISKEDDAVAQQAIEFWTTIAEVESELICQIEDFGKSSEPCHYFIRGSVKFLTQVLLTEALTKQDDDPDSDEWNSQKAAALCLRVVATVVRDDVVQWVMPFVTQNINNANWRFREASVLAFGSILDGPSTASLRSIISNALPVLKNHMNDKEQIVRDTTAWTIGAVCELHPVVAKDFLNTLMPTLVEHLNEKPGVASQVCYAMHYLAEAFEDEKENQSSPLSNYFQGVVQQLMRACDRPDLDESNLRAAVYEALNSMVACVATDKLQLVAELVPLFLTRLDKTKEMEDKNAAADLQALICGVLLAVTTRLGPNIMPFADELMRRLFGVFNTPVPRVHEEALLAIAGVANALGQQFNRYASTPFMQELLVKALRTVDDSHVVSMAVSLVSDMSIALDDLMTPYCDMLMTVLLQDLQNTNLDRDVKPSILSCIGDIALAITGNFEKYMAVVMNVLHKASETRIVDQNDLDFVDYVDSLREGVFEAYSGILHGLNTAKKAQLFASHLFRCVAFVEFIAQESPEIRDKVLLAGVSFIGDVGKCLGPPGIALFQNKDGIRRFVAMAAASKNPKTAEAAEWAKSKLNR